MTSVKNEPVVVAVVAFITATAALLVAFGVHLTQTQIEALSGEAVAALGLGTYIRSKVTPTANPKVTTTTVVSLAPTVPASQPAQPDAEPSPTPAEAAPPATQTFPTNG